MDLLPEKLSESSLSASDSVMLVNLPELQWKDCYAKVSLPAVVDNSKQPYFRPFQEQISLECGQLAAIAYNFTYEINYARNTPANVPDNQYPTHYTFNFMNGGFGWSGVSYLHSLEIARVNGHPNVVDYGGINNPDPSAWMTGYDKYYHGMFNKVDQIFQIKLATTEGLMVLKNWLDNHLNGEDVGGLASFYGDNPWNVTTLPAGTPEGGKHVYLAFPGIAGHANTIVGYNDSIRYDYNQDGQYTNDIDINNDGKIDLRDWEIGGLKFVDGYNGGINYADSGFCYLMYKALVDDGGSGGIWNKAVHVITVKEDYQPKLTYKIKMRHTCRNTVKVTAGISTDIAATSPQYTMGFPIFDYQGACQYMQGGWDPGNDVIEFGLDVTPLLGMINTGEPVRFFLLVDERDPYSWGEGQLLDWSVMDYSGSLHEIVFTDPVSPFTNNGLSTYSLTGTIDFDQLKISNNELPVASTNKPYEYQFNAAGGSPPYKWNLVKNYQVNVVAGNLPGLNGTPLYFPDTIKSQVAQKLDFQFPFYDQKYDSVWVHTDGFLMFDKQPYPWPYMYDPGLMLRKTKNISPFLNFWMYLAQANADGIWYEGNENYAVFRWQMTGRYNQPPVVNFAVKLYPSGKIEFYYGDENIFSGKPWVAGVSLGDDVSYTTFDIPDLKKVSGYSSVQLSRVDYPNGITMSEEGLLSCLPLHDYNALPLEVAVKDNDNLISRKVLPFYSNPAGVDENRSVFTNFRIFPNPVSDNLNIDFIIDQERLVTFSLIDITGKTIAYLGTKQLNSGQGRLSWNLEDDGITGGMYYLVANSDNAPAIVSKIIFLKY